MMTDEKRQQDESIGLRQAAVLYSKGIAMGLGDSVPGVSGGTIAVITNIYDSLVYSIRAVDAKALKLIFAGQFRAFWQHCNGTFLLVLAIGVLSGLLISANTVLFLLDTQFEPLMAFFIGLVLASSFLLLPQANLKRFDYAFVLLLGATFTTGIGLLDPLAVQPSLVYLFFAGAIAISAMILPGLSGAFILLLLGAYEYMLSALVGLQWAAIAIFMLGCVTGLLAFSRVLAWLLSHYHQLSYSFIIGMLLGSLTVLWPWQQVVTSYTDSSGEQHALQTSPIWPLNYTEITGLDPKLLATAIAVLLGIAVVLLLHRVFERKA